MVPLTLTEIGVEQVIQRIGGKPEVKKHLENLGFVAGGSVTVRNMLGGRVAISEELARKIMV